MLLVGGYKYDFVLQIQDGCRLIGEQIAPQLRCET